MSGIYTWSNLVSWVLGFFFGFVVYYFLGLEHKSPDLAIPILGVSPTETFTGLRTRLRYVSMGYEMIFDAYEKVCEKCVRFAQTILTKFRRANHYYYKHHSSDRGSSLYRRNM